MAAENKNRFIERASGKNTDSENGEILINVLGFVDLIVGKAIFSFKKYTKDLFRQHN